MLELRTGISLYEYTDRKQKGIAWSPRTPSVQAWPWHSLIQLCCQNTIRPHDKPHHFYYMLYMHRHNSNMSSRSQKTWKANQRGMHFCHGALVAYHDHYVFWCNFNRSLQSFNCTCRLLRIPLRKWSHYLATRVIYTLLMKLSDWDFI